MEDPAQADRLRATGDRIDVLLEASGSGGVLARQRAEELVRLTADLYGAGIEHILEILHDAGRLDDDVLAALAADDLVASLLLVHGLHPYDVGLRVEQALESVRPYLGSHGGDVELLGITEEGTVRLRLLGSCDGCPSSSVTLKLAVEGAIEAAAPEVTGIEVEEAASTGGQGLIPVDALRSRLDLTTDEGAAPSWEAASGLADLAPGEVRLVEVAGLPVLGCRIGTDLFAYQDGCPRCEASLRGAALARRLGAAVGEAVLRCPACRAHYDVRRAGVSLDEEGGDPLTPVPLLTRDGVISVAVAAPVSA
ncbi:NifU family protein [Nocardioides donggukensis]|uniref:NifU family protein n=1 Tax=Nocardioides donggukensis TaxID=2774019 RepID=A0A927K7Y4_9ACTN|nr:NifU family protein [Nocardioides donggukensis]MBD8869441.1 NifU family protein [Nocardioides donggukensis]